MVEALRLTQEEEAWQVTLRSDDIGRAWQKFRDRIDSEAGGGKRAERYCRYTASEKCALYLHPHEGLEAENANEAGTEWDGMWPVVFETCDYNISIRFSPGYLDKGTEPRVRHVRHDIEAAFFTDHSYSGRNQRGEVVGMSGNISLRNEPGTFRLEFEYQHQGRLKASWLTFEVVSPKLDTKRDYKRLLREVNEEYTNIIFRYLATTYQQLSGGRVRGEVVWMNIFEETVGHYLKNVGLVMRQPHKKVLERETSSLAEHIRRWTPRLEDQYAESKAKGEQERRHICHTQGQATHDTRENRFVGHTLQTIGRRLAHIIDQVLQGGQGEEISGHHHHDLEAYREKIDHLSRHPFFRGLGRYEGESGDSLVLQSRTGYSQVYRDWIKLRRGIDLFDGAASIGTLQIWEVYELWCFIKMKRMVKQLLRTDASGPCQESLESEPQGTLLNPFTNKRMEHEVRFEYPEPEEGDQSEWARQARAHKGDIVTLHYQHTYGRSGSDKDGVRTATTEQRPDIVLNIEKKDGRGIMLTYLYDAKYRVIDDSRPENGLAEEDAEEMEKHGGDYPPPDAINQMHRYRDAIYYSKGFGDEGRGNWSKEVIGGYILFPGRGDVRAAGRRYYSESIGRVNIGAFPLLPNEQRHEDNQRHEEDDGPQLYAHLRNILLEKTIGTDHLQKSIPQRGLQYTDDPDLALAKKWKREKVLIVVDVHQGKNEGMTHYAIGLDMCPKAFEVVKEFSAAKYLLMTNYQERGTRLYKIKGQPTIETAIDKATCQARAFHTPAAGVMPEEELERRKASGKVDIYLQMAIDTAKEEPGLPKTDLEKVKQTTSTRAHRYDPRLARMEEVLATPAGQPRATRPKQ